MQKNTNSSFIMQNKLKHLLNITHHFTVVIDLFLVNMAWIQKKERLIG